MINKYKMFYLFSKTFIISYLVDIFHNFFEDYIRSDRKSDLSEKVKSKTQILFIEIINKL